MILPGASLFDLLVPLLIIISSVSTLGLIYNGSAGEMPVTNGSYKYMVIYAICLIAVFVGCLLFFPKVDPPNKVFYMYHIVFLAYLLSSYSMYVASQTVSISLK